MFDRLTQTLKVYEALCELSNARVLSPETRQQLRELKATLEAEISALKNPKAPN